jgi:hypothetical protein
MPVSTFFIQENCDRCSHFLGEDPEGRHLSFFTRKDVLCSACAEKENRIREKIREIEGPTADEKYEGCGIVPKEYLNDL